MFGSKDLLFTSEKYGVAKSLRFRSGSSTYLNRTPGSAGNRKTWTWSGWVKRGKLASSQVIFEAGNTAGTTNSDLLIVLFNSTDNLRIDTGASILRVTNAVFRDPSAWYHIVVLMDTTQATGANTTRLFVNGVEQTYSTTNNIPQNTDTAVNNTVAHYFGRYDGSSLFYDGYLAEVNFIDGQALTPSSFGFYDNNGIWQPAGYTGTYGTNGFYLKFTDVGATSGANSGYGKDFAGTNYWTTNNFGTTSTGTSAPSYDSMLDSPTNAAGDIGNYCVLNPLFVSGSTLSNGNLTVTTPTTGGGAVQSTFAIPSSGQWYWEVTPSSSNTEIGIVSAQPSSTFLDSCSNAVSYNFNGQKSVDGSSSAYGASYTSGDVIGVACDAGAGTITFYKNNSSQGSISHTTSGLFASISDTSGSVTCSADFNFGQRPFAYTPPSGYSALNTQNLTTPTITNGAAYMAAVTYTGSASTQSVTATSTNSGNNPNAVTFQPDLVWIKDRTNAQSHKLTDAVRGTTKAISTDSTAAEATDANGVTAFNNNGFSLGTGTRAYSDSNLDSYVAWQWKEGVSQGFDIVSYAGDNTSNRNISHNLGVAPAFVWVKSLSTGSFYIYHQNLTGSTYFLKCNSTDGTNAQTNTNTPWGTGNWSSTQFMVTNNATNNLNASSTNYIGYLWAAIAGYSAFGSYTGNGSTDGPFIYTGFRPRWILFKNTSSASSWVILDSSRSLYNLVGLSLYPESSSNELSFNGCDFLSNGFKARSLNIPNNGSGDTIIYAAFAENPFKYSRAR